MAADGSILASTTTRLDISARSELGAGFSLRRERTRLGPDRPRPQDDRRRLFRRRPGLFQARGRGRKRRSGASARRHLRRRIHRQDRRARHQAGPARGGSLVRARQKARRPGPRSQAQAAERECHRPVDVQRRRPWRRSSRRVVAEASRSLRPAEPTARRSRRWTRRPAPPRPRFRPTATNGSRLANYANLRTAPSSNADTLRVAEKGIEASGDRPQRQLGAGHRPATAEVGWVYGRYIQTAARALEIAVLSLASRG